MPACAKLHVMKQTITDYLMRDRMANIDMLEILCLPGAEVLRFDADGVLLQHGELFLLACEPGRAASFLPQMTEGLTNETERLIVLREGEAIEPLVQNHNFQVVMDCYHAVYPSKEPIPYTLPKGTQIRPLGPEHLDFVHAHYHMVDDIDYIRERIEECMFGVFVAGSIVGFAGTHDERSMGLLEILPEYRRLGLAYALEAHLINHLLRLGRVPFCQVSVRNTPSIELQRKLGLELSTTVIHWLARGTMR